MFTEHLSRKNVELNAYCLTDKKEENKLIKEFFSAITEWKRDKFEKRNSFAGLGKWMMQKPLAQRRASYSKSHHPTRDCSTFGGAFLLLSFLGNFTLTPRRAKRKIQKKCPRTQDRGGKRERKEECQNPPFPLIDKIRSSFYGSLFLPSAIWTEDEEVKIWKSQLAKLVSFPIPFSTG